MQLLKEYPSIKEIQAIAKRKKVAVYLVGGFLRDYLLGTVKNDFDFTVEKDALSVAYSFAKKIKGAYVLLDKERGCARVAKRIKGELFTFDFADFRAKTFEEDLSCRDFTINTLSVDITNLGEEVNLNDAIVDKKRALKDIKDKRIKRTSMHVFKDDPLRMMRAFSLRANLGFKIELKTLNLIRKEVGLIKNVSYERIREELFKIFKSNSSCDVIKAMDRCGLLAGIIPQIRIMDNCTQGAYHHLDVWPHSIETVNQLEKIFEKEKNPDVLEYLNETIGGDHTRKGLMKLAALLHDIGKPQTRKREANRFSFHGHEHVGKKITREVGKLLKLSVKERNALESMVLWHLRPGYLSNFKHPSDRMIFRYFRDAKDEAGSILLLSLADQRSTRGPLTTEADQKHHKEICLGLLERWFEKKKEKPFVRLIDGNDLIKQLKIKPSPLFSQILNEVEEQQVLGKIKTKKQALDAARKLLR